MTHQPQPHMPANRATHGHSTQGSLTAAPSHNLDSRCALCTRAPVIIPTHRVQHRCQASC
eukprot:3396480-Prymnesium_polylepis.1